MSGVAQLESDEYFVGRVLSGQRHEFGYLVRRYLPAVRAFACARLGNSADAEDASQEAFLQAFLCLDSLRDRARFSAWLVGIARHTCSGVRNLRRRQALVAEEAQHAPASTTPDVATRDLHALVRRRMEELDEPAREVLFLYYFAGMKIHEVANALEISHEAAAKRIQRAREVLGEKLLCEVRPAYDSEGTDDERRARIMAVVLTMDVPWDGAGRGAPRQTGPVALVSVLLAKHGPRVLLALSVGVLGAVTVWIWWSSHQATARWPIPAPVVPVSQVQQPLARPGAEGGKAPTKSVTYGKGAVPAPSEQEPAAPLGKKSALATKGGAEAPATKGGESYAPQQIDARKKRAK